MNSAFLPIARSGQNPGGIVSIAQSKSRIEPMVRSDWPLFIQVIAKFQKSGEIGIGDTIVRLIGKDRSDAFKKWFERKFQKSCGCTDRQRWLNRRFPYEITAS